MIDMSSELPFLAVDGGWLLILAVVVLALRREIHIVRNTMAAGDNRTLANGLPVGSPAPADHVPRSGTLIFLSPECPPCRDVVADVADALAADTRIVLGGDRKSPQFSAMFTDLSARAPIHIDTDARLRGVFKVKAEPFAIRVENGVVAARGFLRNNDDLARIRG
jgi:hypothetical protein